MSRTRSGSGAVSIENPISPPKKRQKLERGEQSRAQTSSAKGKKREEEGVFVISSDEDDWFLSEDLEIQEALFMSMQSKKGWEGVSVEEEQGSDKSKLAPTDRKGKQLTKSYSKHETGQTSKVTHSKKLCKICMEQAATTQTFWVKSCNHHFCKSCIVQYITSKIDENIAIIPCPHPGCRSGSLDSISCRHILPGAIFDKWSRVLCESSLGSKKFYCPFKDCSALLVDDGDENVKNCECPHCNRMFCAQCKVPWHADMGCREFRSLGKDERGREDLMLRRMAKDKKWQRCPQCRMYVERSEGCMFMKFRCGYCFCYACATPMSKETHYCTKCRR